MAEISLAGVGAVLVTPKENRSTDVPAGGDSLTAVVLTRPSPKLTGGVSLTAVVLTLFSPYCIDLRIIRSSSSPVSVIFS